MARADDAACVSFERRGQDRRIRDAALWIRLRVARDAAQFREKIYRQDFTAKNRACIQRRKAVYDRDQQNNENYFIFCGQLIFGFTKTPAGFLFTDIGMND